MADYYEMFTPGALPAVEPLEDKWYEEERAKKAEKSTFKEMSGPAIRTTAAARGAELLATTIYRPEEDAEWAMTEEVNKEINETYDKDSADYIRKAHSQADFYYRKTVMDDHKRDRDILARGGLAGIGMQFGAAILDPVALGAGMLTGGSSYVTKATGFSRIARGAMLAGVEVGAVEAVIAAADPHYKWQDFVLNVGVGSLLGGAFNIRGARARELSDMADDALLESATELTTSRALRNGADASPEVDAQYPGYDLPTVQRDIDTKTDELRRMSDQKVTHKEIQAERRNLAKLEKQHADLQGNIKRAKEEVKFHQTKNFDERLKLEDQKLAKLDDLKVRYDKDLAQAQKKLDEATKRLDALMSKKKPNAKKVNKAKSAHWKAGNNVENIGRRYKLDVMKAEGSYKRGVSRVDNKLRMEVDNQSQAIRTEQSAVAEQITQSRTRIDELAHAKKAPDTLKWWDTLTLKKRMDFLYQGNPPTKATVPEEVALSWAETKAPGIDPATGGQSAGAAATSDFPSAYDLEFRDVQKYRGWEAEGEALPSTIAVMKTAAGRAIGSMSNLLTTSGSMAMRGFASKILENPQGGFRGPTMAIFKEIEERTMRAATRGRVEPAFEGWMKAKGNNYKDVVFNPKFRDNFNTQVFKGIYDPSSISDEFVKEAADAYRDVFSTALGRMQKYGVKAFEGVSAKANYVPRIMNTTKIKLLAGRPGGKERIRKLLTRGYMTGDYKMPREAAEAMADAHINRTMDNTLTMMDGAAQSNVLTSEQLTKSLKEAGVPPDVIEVMTEARIMNAGEMMMQDRARASMGINPQAEVDGLSVTDLLETNMPSIMDRYVKESAFDASLGRMGYASRAEFEADVQLLEKSMKNSLDHTGQTMADVEKEMQVLRDGIRMLQGKAIDQVSGTAFGKGMRRLQNYTGLVRLGQVGIATIPEAARVMATRPWYMMRELIPAMSFIGSKGQRGGSWAGKLERPDWEEMDQVLQYAGDDHIMYGEGLRSEVLEEGFEDSRAGKLFDNAMNYGKKLQSVTSGFRLVQGSLERFSVRTIGMKITDQALDGKKLFTKAEIESAGWTDDTFEAILDHVRTNGGSATLDSGRVIRTINPDKMDNALFDQFQLGVHRIAGREMQRMVVGETPRYMHTALGSVLTQFRSFVIGSMEKQLMFDLKHNRGKMTTIALTSVMLSGMAHGIRTNLNALGREDSEEYVNSRMSGMNLAWGIFGGMGQLASVTPALDLLATVGAVPDELLAAPGKMGARQMGAQSVPAIGMVGAGLKTVRDLSEIISGDGDDVNLARDVRSLIPYMKVLGLQQGLNVIESN